MNQGHCLIESIVAIAILCIHIQIGINTLHSLLQAKQRIQAIYAKTHAIQLNWEQSRMLTFKNKE